ncbi:MAG: hypothetical protein ABIJ34_00995 [archaeon]
MKNAQIISMDFILTFVIFMFGMSIFFFALNDSYFAVSPGLDVSADLVFSKLENIYEPEYSFIRSFHFDKNFIFLLLTNYNASKAYELYFQEYENPASFSKIDYCLFLMNSTNGRKINLNFAAYKTTRDKYEIIMGDDSKCGDNPQQTYVELPKCPKGVESVIASKPVLYEKGILQLNVLMCAKKN